MGSTGGFWPHEDNTNRLCERTMEGSKMNIKVLSLRIDPANVLDEVEKILDSIRPTWNIENLVKEVSTI